MKKAMSEVTRLLERVNEYEDLLDITGERWGQHTPAYQEAKKSTARRAYNLALDTVERLVVQRLFELQKTHLASTGTWSMYRRSGSLKLTTLLSRV